MVLSSQYSFFYSSVPWFHRSKLPSVMSPFVFKLSESWRQVRLFPSYSLCCVSPILCSSESISPSQSFYPHSSSSFSSYASSPSSSLMQDAHSLILFTDKLGLFFLPLYSPLYGLPLWRQRVKYYARTRFFFLHFFTCFSFFPRDMITFNEMQRKKRWILCDWMRKLCLGQLFC